MSTVNLLVSAGETGKVSRLGPLGTVTNPLSSCSPDITVTALSDTNEVCIITKGQQLPYASLLANLPPEPSNQDHLGLCHAASVPFQSNHLCRPIQASQTIFSLICLKFSPSPTPLSLVHLHRPLSPSSTYLDPSLPRPPTSTPLSLIQLPRSVVPSSTYLDPSPLHPPTSTPLSLTTLNSIKQPLH